MRGRKPTPTHLKLLRGNPSHRPLPSGEPVPASAPTCPLAPDFLNAYAVEEWARMAPELFRLGLLTKIDTALFAVYCSTYAQWRSATEQLAEAAAADPKTHGLLIERDHGLIANPLVGVARRAAETMLRVATEFGMTPAARSRITTNPADGPPGKFDGLIASRRPVKARELFVGADRRRVLRHVLHDARAVRRASAKPSKQNCAA